MALQTRILLRNDTLANWESSSSITLGKGEVAIATLDGGKLAEVRVGTGTSKWADALKLNIGTDQVSGLSSLISSLVGDGAKKYQVVANGEGGNSWKLQEAALSGGNWSDVTGSTWTVDFTAINNAITGLTADVSYLSGQIDATNETLNTVSSDYLKATDFATISNDIGLSAANSDNPVVTKNDIASLDKVMHFKGVVNAVPVSTEGYEVGDVVLVAGATGEAAKDNGKEFVLVNTGTDAEPVLKWELIGDQNAISALTEYVDTKIVGLSNAVTANYATKNDLTASAHGLSTDYNTKFENLTSTYATKEYADSTSAYALGEAKTYTETLSGEVEAISAIITSDYAEKTYVNGISAALSTDYVGKIKAVNDKLADYALSADVDTVAADTLAAAKQYADDQDDATESAAKEYADDLCAALSTTVETDYIKHGEVVQSDLCGFFILDCGASTLRTDEPTPPFSA